MDIDYDLAQSNAGGTAHAIQTVLRAPDPSAWRDMLHWCAQAIPPPRAAALAGLQWPKVKGWLNVNPEAAQQLQEVKAQVSAKLVSVIWHEATEEGNWKAAISLLRHVDPAFNPAPKKQKVEISHNTQINAQAAQVIAGSSTEDLRKVLGLA